MTKVSEREMKWLDGHDLKGRSPLYKFIRKNFAKLKKRKVGMDDGPSWARLTEWLTMRGQTNSRGEPLSWDGVRKVFMRVRRDIEAEECERLVGVIRKRSRAPAPKGWSPTVSSKNPVDQNELSPFAPALTTADGKASDDISPEELISGIRSVIAKRSGR